LKNSVFALYELNIWLELAPVYGLGEVQARISLMTNESWSFAYSTKL
jgi:hypothetical protein